MVAKHHGTDAPSAEFVEFLCDQMAPLGPITMRRMFGKVGVFCEGVMFGIVTEDTLYVRVDALNRVTFQESASLPPLNYVKQGRTIDLAFWRVPDRFIDDADTLVMWAQAALAAAHRVAANRAKTAPKRRPTPQPTSRSLPATAETQP